MTKTLLLFCLLFAVPSIGFSQKNTSDTGIVKLYGRTYHKPMFCGGEDSLRSFIKKKIRYPDAARENNMQGKVFIRFMVDEKGNLLQPKVVRGIGGGCDEEALRIIKAMPKWMPALYKGKPTRTFEVLPVVFKLE